MYFVLKQKRKYYSENWYAVSLYDNENYFRGQAIFETESEAKSYMKKYSERLQNRNDSNLSNNHISKIKIDLKIFEEKERPQIAYPFYYKKQRYN